MIKVLGTKLGHFTYMQISVLVYACIIIYIACTIYSHCIATVYLFLWMDKSTECVAEMYHYYHFLLLNTIIVYSLKLLNS